MHVMVVALLLLRLPSACAQGTEHRQTTSESAITDSSPQKTQAWFDRHFVFRLANDQKTFWAGGKGLIHSETKIFVPFVAFTAALIASDSWVAGQVPDRPEQLQRSRKVSDLGLFSLGAAAGGALLLGKIIGNDHWRETGLLSGEAMLNSTASTFVVKGLTQRKRP